MANTHNLAEYNKISKFFHWLIALLIIFNYIGGLSQKLFHYQFIELHKQFGLSILVLVLLRIIWNTFSSYPSSAKELSLYSKIFSKIGHVLLYILMVLIPLFGIILVQSKGYKLELWGIINIPNLIDFKPHNITHKIKEIHEYLAHTIIIIAGIHSLFAIKHHYINRDSVLKRMLPKSTTKF